MTEPNEENPAETMVGHVSIPMTKAQFTTLAFIEEVGAGQQLITYVKNQGADDPEEITPLHVVLATHHSDPGARKAQQYFTIWPDGTAT